MSRSYRSIGDVLTLLRAEFPDITISKIRFLESQGLVSPQRSPSGYRKFYDEDVERLRYVLVQQREHFLPLKVIRDRLNGIESDEDTSMEHSAEAHVESTTTSTTVVEVVEIEKTVETVSTASATAPEPKKTSAPKTAARSSAKEPTVADVLAALQELPVEATPVPPVKRPEPSRSVRKTTTRSSTTMTIEELSAETGLTEKEIRSLIDFGIVRSTDVAGLTCFDDRAVEIARLATGFLSMGIEARHLKLYRNAVEREMGLVEQMVTPLLRQRNPEARVRAEAMGLEITQLGESLRTAMMEDDLDRFLGR